MPIIIDEMKLPITPAEARNIIQRQTDNFGVFFDVDRCYELAAILQLENKDIIRNLRRLSLDPTLILDDKLKVIDTLISMGVNKVDFYPGKSRDPQLNAKVFAFIEINENFAQYCLL